MYLLEHDYNIDPRAVQPRIQNKRTCDDEFHDRVILSVFPTVGEVASQFVCLLSFALSKKNTIQNMLCQSRTMQNPSHGQDFPSNLILLRNLQQLCSGSDPGFFFRRGCTTKEFLLFYFNINKPHFCFLQNTSCIRKPRVISGGGGCAPLHPPPRSAPVCCKLWPKDVCHHVININFKLLNRKRTIVNGSNFILSDRKVQKQRLFNGFYKSINATAIISSCHTPHLKLSGFTTIACFNFI